MISKPASDLSSEELATAFNDSFVGHLGGPVHFTGPKMKAWNEAHYVELSRSHIFYDDNNVQGGRGRQAIALCLLSILREDKPNQVRVAAFGVVPQVRGKGTARKALERVIETEKSHGTHLMELECLQTNVAAVKLYARLGFKQVRELTGWERDAAAPVPEEDEDEDVTRSDEELPTECSIAEVDRLVRQRKNMDLPWQAWHFATLDGADRAYRLGNAWCVVSDPDKQSDETPEKEKKEEAEAPIKMMSLIVEAEHRSKGQATRLIMAMVRRFPGRAWTSRAVFPREYGGKDALLRTGFKEIEGKQFLKRLELKP
jgi:GNAT superfamily N-acetyltransferase